MRALQPTETMKSSESATCSLHTSAPYPQLQQHAGFQTLQLQHCELIAPQILQKLAACTELRDVYCLRCKVEYCDLEDTMPPVSAVMVKCVAAETAN